MSSDSGRDSCPSNVSKVETRLNFLAICATVKWSETFCGVLL